MARGMRPGVTRVFRALGTGSDYWGSRTYGPYARVADAKRAVKEELRGNGRVQFADLDWKDVDDE